MKRNLWMRILTACLCAVLMVCSAYADTIVDIGKEGYERLVWWDTLQDGRLLFAGNRSAKEQDDQDQAWLVCLNQDCTVSWEYLDETVGTVGFYHAHVLPDGTIGVWFWQTGENEDTISRQSLKFFTQDGKPTGKEVVLTSDEYVTINNVTPSYLVRNHQTEKESWSDMIDWDGNVITRFGGEGGMHHPYCMIEEEDGLILFGSRWTDETKDNITRTDLQGNVIWKKTIPSPWQDDIEPEIDCPVRTEDSGYLIVQYNYINQPETNGRSMRTAITKLDRDGNVIWTKPVDEEESMWFYGMTMYNGKTVLVYEQPAYNGTQRYVWRFHWFDEGGNELGKTEMMPDDLLAFFEDPEQKNLVIEGIQLVPMKDELWGIASVFEGEEYGYATRNDVLIKVPEV